MGFGTPGKESELGEGMRSGETKRFAVFLF